MGVIARRFTRPTGVLGDPAGRVVTKHNAALDHWVAAQLVDDRAPLSFLELGSGAGAGSGAQALLTASPSSTVTILDSSTSMGRQLRRRNRRALAEGRLVSVRDDLGHCDPGHRFDVVMAVHVVYFWADPGREFALIRGLLEVGGVLALGYQLRHHMSSAAQRSFLKSGHRLYESDEELLQLTWTAGLDPRPVRVLTEGQNVVGRLLIAARPD